MDEKMPKGKHYQACCMNGLCTRRPACEHAKPHALEEACFRKCDGTGDNFVPMRSCALVVVTDNTIEVVKYLEE